MRVRGLAVTTLTGLAVWAAMFALPVGEDVQEGMARILLLMLLALFPAGLALVEEQEQSNALKTGVFLQPFAAVIVAGAFLLPPGVLAGTLAIAWLPFTGFLAWHGLMRFQRRGWRESLRQVEELCVDAALAYLPVGAVWLFASRMGIELMGFDEPVVILTAIHFHFAGFAAPLLAGLAGRRVREGGGRLGMLAGVGWVVAAGPALVALGFTFSPLVEALAAVTLAAGYLGLSVATLFSVLKRVGAPARALLAVSALSAVVTMFAAAAYAFGNYGGRVTIAIPQMVNVHGWVNALGFVACGLAGWVWERGRG